MVFLLLAGVFLGTGCARKEVTDPVWLGHVAPLSGPDKAMGEQARQALLLAVEEANAAEEHVAGRKVAIYHADTRSQPEMVRSEVWRLVTVNRVRALLGGVETADVDNVGSIAQGNGVPFLLAAPAPPRPASEFVFYTGLSPAWHGQVLARFASQELKATKVALLIDDDPRHSALADAVAHELPRTALLGRWSYAADKLKPAVLEIIDRKPGALVFAGSPSDFAALATIGLDSKVPVLYAGDEGSLKALEAMQPVATVYAVTAFADDGKAATKEFVKKYQDRFSEAPEAAAALAYDNARLLFDAIRQAKSFDGLKVRDALRELRIDGLTGPLSFEQHTLRRPAFVLQLKGGKNKLEKRYEPEEKK